jgi:DNA polymerase III subunit delta
MKIANAQIDSYIQRISHEKIAGCLIYGPETSVVNYRFNLIAKKICPDLSDPFLVANINKERLSDNKGILSEEFFSFSMLGGRKLIAVKDCDASAGNAIKELFSDYEFAKKSDNFILIEAGDLDKSSALRKLCEENQNFAVIACYEDDERSIKIFIENELRRREIKFTRDVTDFIYEKLGKNRQIIMSELEKISVFLGENKNLTIDLLGQTIELQAEISANEFILNFAAKKFDIATIQAEKLLKEGFEAITLIRFLSNYLQKIYQAKSDIEHGAVDFEDAVKSQRLFFKTEIEFRKHLKTNSFEFIKEILLKLADIEIKIKSGTMPSRLVFTAFVSGLIK